jgi:CHASE2 domain-containing sensor protein
MNYFKIVKNSIFSFLFVSGIVFLLDNKLNLLEIIHSATLRNIYNSIDKETKNKVYNNNSDSLALLITNDFYEKEFNSTSPLNKEKLYNLIKNITKQKPKAIIIDFSISPNSLQQTENEIKLYEYLKEISKEINIVLPFAFFSNSNLKNQEKWIKDICKSNIKLAIPFITSEIGLVLKYNNFQNHISHVAYTQNSNICKSLKTKSINEVLTNNKKLFTNQKEIPVNYSKITHSTIYLNNMSEIKKYNLSNKTVFLGGGYGFTDIYKTPYSERFGVEILNAIYYSITHPIEYANLLNTSIIDILNGLLFGFFISFILRKKSTAKTQNMNTFYNLSLIIILFLFIIISLSISSIFFHKFFVWINPVPIILGMFIDLVINSEKKDFNDSFKTAWFAYFLRSCFIILGLYSFF